MPWSDGLIPKTLAHAFASSGERAIHAITDLGFGKNFTIKRRISKLLETRTSPGSVLTIAFNRITTQDLRRQIFSIGVPGPSQVHSRTLHGHSLRTSIQGDAFEQTGRMPCIGNHEIALALRYINND